MDKNKLFFIKLALSIVMGMLIGHFAHYDMPMAALMMVVYVLRILIS